MTFTYPYLTQAYCETELIKVLGDPGIRDSAEVKNLVIFI